MSHFWKSQKQILIVSFVLISIGFSTLFADQSEAVQGKNGMAATAHPLATKAAIDILKMGGNAVDAAVAAAFTIGVVEPDGSGLGGGGGMVVYLKDQDKSFYINYYQQASGRIDEIDFNRDTDRHTVESILIPGTTEGLTTALEKFGTLPLSKVMEAAIFYAENGFEVDQTLATIILDNMEMLQIDSSTSQIYLDEGFPKMEGDSLKQPELAKTLRLIAQKGRDGFYAGPIAEELISQINTRGGAVCKDDFDNYKAIISEPVLGSYRGYTVLGADAPHSGATIIQALNMLENDDLQELGHYSNSANTLHLMAETFKRAYTDRWYFIGDKRFGDVPQDGIVSKKYAQKRFEEINHLKAVPETYRKTKPGNPAEFQLNAPEKLKSSIKMQLDGIEQPAYAFETEYIDNKVEQEYDGHTTHLSIVDKNGNAVSLTQTLGTFFGSGHTFAGVLLNCGITNFSANAKINQVKPGMRPRSSISPTIVLKEKNPFLVVGSPGAGRIIATVVELIVNAVDFGMNVTETNDAPRFYCQKWDDYLHIEYGISQTVQDQLTEMGHNLKYYAAPDLFFGGAQLIFVDQKTGTYFGSADKRRGGVAIGY